MKSAEVLDFEIPYTVEELMEAKELVVKAERLSRTAMCAPSRGAGQRNDGGCRAAWRKSTRHRRLGLAVDV